MAMQATETWKPAFGIPGYELSSLGQMRNSSTRHVLKPQRDKLGYVSFVFQYNGKARHVRANRLVCMAFHGPAPSARHEAAHLNGIRADNAESNLRWKTKLENAADKRAHRTMCVGVRHGRAKLNPDAVRAIKDLKVSGLSDTTIARRFGVARSCVWAINSGKNWKTEISA